MQQNKASVFANIRVVELAGGPSAYAGKLFADYGAEVIRIEPKEGDPARLEKPFIKDTPGIENSLRYQYLNTNKKSVVLDITVPEGKKAFLDLIGTADLLIESFPPGYLESLGLGYKVLSSVKPEIVHTAITPFGQTGPYKDYPFSDLTCMAMGGMLFLAGNDDDKPALAPDKQSFFQADLYAALASLVALLHAGVTSEGQFIDVSIQEAVATALENAIQTYDLEGRIRRAGAATEAGYGTYKCRDGYVYVMVAFGSNRYLWDPLVDWMIEEKIEGAEILRGEEWVNTEYRKTEEARAIFKRVFEQFSLKHPKLELYEESQKRKCVIFPINNAKDILENPQFVYRKFFKTLYSESAGTTITYPGTPVYIEKIPWELKNPAPALGQHTSEVLSQLRKSPENIKSSSERESSVSGKRPLECVRVCDFSWVGAGPLTTRLLAEYGAEVIRLETRTRPEILRMVGPYKDGIPGIERSGYFSSRNPNKKSIDIDMKHPKARDVVVKLIKESDIVINNFTNGVMEKWNLGYEDVKKIKPDIIYAAMPSMGSTGPHKDYMGFGASMGALVGINYLSGFPDGEPFGTGTNYPDHVPNPAHTAFAIVAALLHKRETGEGQMVEISQIEAAAAVFPTAVMNYAVNGSIMSRQGNRDPNAAPHGVYTTKGNQRWIAIAVFSDTEWEALKKVMGSPAWADSEMYATLEGRLANQDQLDRMIEAWTAQYEGYQLMDKLVRAGIRAGVVQNAKDLLEDPHLHERGYWVYLNHPELRRHVYNNNPAQLSKTPVHLNTAAPLLGQHTDEVMREVLGLTDQEISKLKEEKVIG